MVVVFGTGGRSLATVGWAIPVGESVVFAHCRCIYLKYFVHGAGTRHGLGGGSDIGGADVGGIGGGGLGGDPRGSGWPQTVSDSVGVW